MTRQEIDGYPSVVPFLLSSGMTPPHVHKDCFGRTDYNFTNDMKSLRHLIEGNEL